MSHLASRILSEPSIRHPGKFPRQFLKPAFFVYRVLLEPYKYKTSAFATSKCRLKVKSAGELARMASKWRIDGVFWTSALKKGTSFHENRTSGQSLFCDGAIRLSTMSLALNHVLILSCILLTLIRANPFWYKQTSRLLRENTPQKTLLSMEDIL